MGLTNEAAFEQALDGAVEEAVNEVDAVVDDDSEEAESLSPDETPTSEEIVEESEEADEVFEAADDEVDEQVEEAQSVVEWNGNPDELPSDIEYDGKTYDLNKTYKAMQAGFTKKMQELADKSRKYEELSQQAMQNIEAQRQVALEADNVRPANPTTEMSETEQEARWDEIQRWTARQAYQDMVKEGLVPDPDRVNRQLAEQEQQAAASKRLTLLQSQEGWGDAIESKMIEVADANQYWQNALTTDDGALAFFNYVKAEMSAEDMRSKAAELENAKVKRSASASKRATPKPAAQKKSVATPADNFADMGFEDKIDAVIRGEFDL